MRALVGLCLSLCPISLGALSHAQEKTETPAQVEVTFYSSGRFLNGVIPGNKHGSFAGRIMDGSKQLALIEPGDFVTFHMDAGPHTFAANSWMIPYSQGGGHLKVDLIPGKHYFVGAYLEQLLAVSLFRLELRSCEQAQKDNQGTEPLERKHLRKYGAERLIAETTFPVCS